jgi:hypothetical protein
MVRLNNKHLQITGVLPKPSHTRKDITTLTEIEKLLLEQNKRHLQQTIIEGGTSNAYPMPMFQQDMGISTVTDSLLSGQFTTKYKVPPPVAAWI